MHRPVAGFFSSTAMFRAAASVHCWVGVVLLHLTIDISEPAVVCSARHQPFDCSANVPAGSGVHCCAVELAQVTRTAVEPDRPRHLPPMPETTGPAGRVQCWLTWLAVFWQVTSVGLVPLTTAPDGPFRQVPYRTSISEP